MVGFFFPPPLNIYSELSSYARCDLGSLLVCCQPLLHGWSLPPPAAALCKSWV